MPTQIFTKATVFVCIVIFTLASCGDKSSSSTETEMRSETSFDKVAARKAVEDGSKELMDRLKDGDSTGFANVFTIDAKVLPSGAPAVSGRDAIRSLFGSFIVAGFRNLFLTTVDVWGNKEFIIEEGSWKSTDSSDKETDHGKYLKLWKQEDGKWKIFRESFNSDIPPSPRK